MITIFVLALFNQVLGFRFAWRPGTKVFPYENFPENSIIDNGDNQGNFIEETVFYQDVLPTNSTCVDVWIGNGACNRENNKPECNWDGGDCCRNSCINNCKNQTLQKNQTCNFECGSFNGYECHQPEQGCASCHPEHGRCRS